MGGAGARDGGQAGVACQSIGWSGQAEFVEQSMWARNLSIEALKEVIEAPDRKSDVVAAVRELNAMHGFHEAQKIEHSGSIASIERRIVDVGTSDASAVDAAPNKKDPR